MKKLFFFVMTAVVLMGCKSNGPGEGERVIDMLPKTRFIELTESQKDFINKNQDKVSKRKKDTFSFAL